MQATSISLSLAWYLFYSWVRWGNWSQACFQSVQRSAPAQDPTHDPRIMSLTPQPMSHFSSYIVNLSRYKSIYIYQSLPNTIILYPLTLSISHIHTDSNMPEIHQVIPLKALICYRSFLFRAYKLYSFYIKFSIAPLHCSIIKIALIITVVITKISAILWSFFVPYSTLFFSSTALSLDCSYCI